MSDTQDNEQNCLEGVKPKACVTFFDLFHFMGALFVAGWLADTLGSAYGIWVGLVSFVLALATAFMALGYATGAFVLFVHNRYTVRSRIGYEAACYVLPHYRRDTEHTKRQRANVDGSHDR